METNKVLVCPKCNGRNFTVNKKVTYIYEYKINSTNFKDTATRMGNVPFDFENREKVESEESICCDNCKAEYNLDLDKLDNHIDFTIVQKAIRSDLKKEPEYIG